MSAEREAVLVLTHFLDDRIVAMARRLRAEAGRDVFVLFNKSDDNNPGFVPPPDVAVFSFVEDDLTALGYPGKGLHIRDVDIELFSFPFHRSHPQYDRLWVVEYDVDFTGRWATVFDAFADSPADLLATSVHRFDGNPGWDNWKSVRTPSGRPNADGLVRAFLPFMRLSRAAYAVLDGAYRAGWSGHYECTVPTILAEAGLVIEDIGGDGAFVAPGNRNRFYTSTPGCNDLSPGSFVFRPIRTQAGERPDTLWHPVKPPATAYVRGWRTGRVAMLTRRAMTVSRRQAAMVAKLFGG
jgi:hypothetical protein